MVKILSSFIAIIISLALVIVLYPIAAVLWILGVIGKLGEKMFIATNTLIKNLWTDIMGSSQEQNGNPPQ